MSLIPANITRTYRVGHLCCGIGAGAKGFNDANPRIGHVSARFQCAGGVDVDAGAIRNFERITGAKGTVMDLFDAEQYEAFHGKAPGRDWRAAGPADIRAAFGGSLPLDVMFASMPCKGFSGLLSSKASESTKYQALNRLTLRGIWLALEAYKDDPIPIILFENVPRIATRGAWLLNQIKALLRAHGYVFVGDKDIVHDCGEIGGLAQSRKRFLLVARHAEKVPPFLYQPIKSKLRGVGEVIGLLPLPGDKAAGPMHRVPMLQWKTWVRLAFVEPGKDWRSLNDLRVENGVLADFGLRPERQLRDNALGVMGWEETAPTLTSQRSPGQGRFSVADPRIDSTREGSGHMGVNAWDDSCGTIAGASRPGNGAFSVADPRPNAVNQTYQQYGVRGWDEPSGAVSGQSQPGGGAYSVADPRPSYTTAHKNVFRIIRWDDHAGTITSGHSPSNGAGAVADPRPAGRDDGYKQIKYKVTPFDSATGTVIGASTTGNGAFAVADPRADAFKEGRESYKTQGHYGVVDWDDHSGAVPGYAKYDRGNWSVADPRVPLDGPEFIDLPKPNDRLPARIIARDGTWHRPFTTLELAALQSLFDPGEIFDLEGGSDQVKREWIGNAVPSASARGMAETIGETLILACLGETFMLSSREIWAKPLALALSVDVAEAHLG